MVHNTQNLDCITVQFYVNSKTNFGQNVYISGSSQQLGHWTPHQGVKLETNRKNYPQWFIARPLLLRANTFIQFKACIIKDSMVLWESLPQNRMILTGSKAIQVYFNFDCTYTQVCEKKIVEIECRNGIDNIMNEMESDWGSSIGHPSNYPLQKYHKFKRGDQTFNRSQVSSNLMSATDSDQIELELKILNFFNPGSLVKTLSRPSDFEWKRYSKKINDISLNMNSIPQGSETGTQSPKGRSYRSLPKNYSRSPQKAILESRVQARKSFPSLFGAIRGKEKSRTAVQNTKTHNTERKVKSENETVKASLFSQGSDERQEKSDLDEEVEDLFGLEIF